MCKLYKLDNNGNQILIKSKNIRFDQSRSDDSLHIGCSKRRRVKVSHSEVYMRRTFSYTNALYKEIKNSIAN